MEYIPRVAINVLKKYLRQFKVVLLTGPRQVGKSTLLQKTLQPKFEYITLDDMDEMELAQTDVQQFFINHKNPLIIDEVQYAPDLFRQIKFLVDKSTKKGMFCLTGSQTYELMQNVSESLAGRIGILQLSPLSLRELNKIDFDLPFIPKKKYYAKREPFVKKEKDIWQRIFRGSMPELTNKKIDWSFFYNSYIQSYIQRDVRQIIGVKDERLFYNFLIAVASRTGSLFVANDVANSLGVSLHTVKSWLSVLEASGIIFILHPYTNNILNRAIKTPKVYFMDTGLVCALVGWTNPTVLKNGAMAGNIFETFVVSEIIKSYKNAGLDAKNIYYYRDRDKKEIDMLIIENETIYPIEIKKSALPAVTMAKNFPTLKEIPGMKMGEGCILCLAEKFTQVNDKLAVVPLEYI